MARRQALAWTFHSPGSKISCAFRLNLTDSWAGANGVCAHRTRMLMLRELCCWLA
jgi:hypothetical protein